MIRVVIVEIKEIEISKKTVGNANFEILFLGNVTGISTV
jgi:hypothetical protein